MSRQTKTKKLVYMGVLLALGWVLPFLTGQVPRIGNMLLPMHLPVFLCGYICGGPAGFLLGFLLPISRSFIFSMPPLMPNALTMGFELACYGLVSGLLFGVFKKKLHNSIVSIYGSLLSAMIVGRIVWGIAAYVIYQAMGNHFTWQIFFLQGFKNAVLGIILQLILVPVLVIALQKSGAMEE